MKLRIRLIVQGLGFVILILISSASYAQKIKPQSSFSKKINVRTDKIPARNTGQPPTVGNEPNETTTPAVGQPEPGNPPAPTEDEQATSSETDRERRGPANITFTLASQILSDVDFTGQELLHVFNTIYRDDNRHSGYYYFLPASYNLSWSAGTGSYEFNASYSAANESGRGETTVTAILKPKLGGNELKLVKELLRKSIEGKLEEQYGITDLTPMPLSRAPEISFSNLGQFGVEEQHISIRAPSDLLDPIYISFTTSRIDDLMGMFFNNIGLYGDVIIYPAGEGMPESIRIPFNLKIDDPGTFGMFELQSGKWRSGWQNRTDYPVVLTRFNILKKESNGDFKVYTWQMGDQEVPEQANVNFDGSLVPSWIDSNPGIVRIWMDYSVQACVSCNNNVKDKIIRGTSGSRVNAIEFTVLTPLAFTKAQMMKIKVRSFQADPNGLSKVNLPTLTITQDGTTHSGGQIFVPDGGTPEFEYLVQVYLADGTKYEADGWRKSNELEVVIGTTQIRDMISHFK